jgi:ABC-type tungstate transport system permease subunit
MWGFGLLSPYSDQILMNNRLLFFGVQSDENKNAKKNIQKNAKEKMVFISTGDHCPMCVVSVPAN